MRTFHGVFACGGSLPLRSAKKYIYSVIFEHHPEINYGKFTCAGWTMS